MIRCIVNDYRLLYSQLYNYLFIKCLYIYLKKMPLLKYMLFLLSYHLNTKTLHIFFYYLHLPLKRTSSYEKKHSQLINIPKNNNFETKRTNDPHLWTIADDALYRIASLLCTSLLHTFS